MRPRPRANRCATLCWLLLATAFGALLSNSWATFRELTTHEPWARPAPAPTPRPAPAPTPQPTIPRTPQPTPGTQAAALRAKLERVATANTAEVRARETRRSRRCARKWDDGGRRRREGAGAKVDDAELAKLRKDNAELGTSSATSSRGCARRTNRSTGKGSSATLR